MEIEPRRLYTVEQVAVILSRSKESVRRLVRAKQIKGRNIGRRVYVLGADLLTAGEAAPDLVGPLFVQGPQAVQE